MSRQYSPFTVRLFSRIVLAFIILLSILLAILLLPIVLFIASFLACSLLAIYLLKKLAPSKKRPHEHYDIEVHPIVESDLEVPKDVPRGGKIEQE